MTTLITALIIQGALMGLSAAGAPGPLQTYVINQSLQKGWQYGATAAFSPLLTDILIVPVIIFTLDKIPSSFLLFIQFAGSALLFYLGTETFKAYKKHLRVNIEQPQEGEYLPILLRGMAMNFLSPGPYLFWSLVNGPILLAAWEQSVWAGTSFVISFYTVLVLGLIAISLIFNWARQLGDRFVSGATLVSALVFWGFGVKLALDAIAELTH